MLIAHIVERDVGYSKLGLIYKIFIPRENLANRQISRETISRV
jgi:hypothetical protein